MSGITGFDHHFLKVEDIERSIKFYEFFGLKETARSTMGPATIVMISDGGFCLELCQNDKPAPEGDGKFAHLCFKTDDIDATVADMKAKGFVFTTDGPKDMPLFGGIRNINLLGPDGELLEIIERK